MATKTKAPDADVDAFYYRVDLTIDPPLPDSKVRLANDEFLKLKQFKDEDVALVNGEIVVISKNVTLVEPTQSPATYVYGYKNLKVLVKEIARIAKDAGSKLDGSVIVRTPEGKFFRLSVSNNVVKVEPASLSWPDGTTTPFPDDGGA